tara:strand:+ start:330 stop:605 length:276 start_codon:yes stop_codon:yes gene_type:complete
MSYEKEHVLGDLVFIFTCNIYIKKTINCLTTYTRDANINKGELLNAYELKILSKSFKKMLKNKRLKRDKKISSNSFVRRRRITEDTPLLIF